MLKTLYVTNVPSPYRVSFLELLGRRTDLTVLYERKTANDRDNRWWTAEDTHHYQEVCLKGLPIRADSSLSRGIVSHLHLHAYDRILLCNYSSPSVMLAIRYLRRLGIPFGIICDGILPKPEEKDGWKLRLKRSLVSAADFWLSSGPVTTEELVRIGAVRDRIFRYPLSSVSESDLREAARCDRASAKRSLGLEGKTVLLYVGRFIPCKGLDVLIHAFAQLKSSHPELALLMVGGTAGELTSLGVESLPQDVHCVGFQRPDALRRFYAAGDLLVFPTRGDSWGLVVNEAFAYGLPVVTTDRCVAGLTLVQDGVTGAIVPPDDPVALCGGILRGLGCVNVPEIRAVAAEYTIEAMAGRTAEILESLS